MYEDTRISLLGCGCKQIELGGTVYLLNDSVAVSRGGSCLVYHAIRKDAEKASRDRNVIIKEFYPFHKDSGNWRKEDGRLELPENLEEIAGKRTQFENSYDRITELCNTGMDNNTVKPEIFASKNKAAYMIVEYSSGITLDAYMKKCGLFAFFEVMRNLAGVLGMLHEKGYLHMDVKPSNILCLATNPEYPEHRALTRLLDTDSFISKANFFKEIAENGMSGTHGYSAPEVIELAEDLEDFTLKEEIRENGERADVFSFGAVLYEYIFDGELPGPPYEISRSYKDLQESLQKKYENIPLKAVSLISELLRFTLEEDPYERCESMPKIGEAISRILPLINPREVRVQENFVPNRDPLIGRKRQMTDLRTLMCRPNTGTRVVCITGIGGIGKSALAREYAKIYREEYDIIVEVSADSAVNAITGIHILNWEMDEDTKAEQYVRKLANLSQKFRTLVLVHDYDVFSDPTFKMWSKLGNCSVILTSRYDQSGNGAPTVALHSKDLSAKQAREIFLSYYLQKVKDPVVQAELTRTINEETEALDALLSALNHHPLGIKLTARYLAAVPGEEQGPRQGILQLEKEMFSAVSAVKIPDNKDNIAPLQANVYGHLEVLLRKSLENGQLTEQDQDALRYMTLIPSSYGISTKRFRKWTGLEAVCLENLRQTGWLEYMPNQKDALEEEEHRGVYVMPLVIQEFLQKGVFSPYKTEKYSIYLDALIRTMQEGNNWAIKWEYGEKCIRAFAGERTKEYLYLLMETATAYQRVPGFWDKFEDKVIWYWVRSLELCKDYPEDPLLQFQRFCRMAGDYPSEEELPYLEAAREVLFSVPRSSWNKKDVLNYIQKCLYIYEKWQQLGRYDDLLRSLPKLFWNFRHIKGRWQHELLRDLAWVYEKTGSEKTAAWIRKIAMKFCLAYEDESPRYPLGTYSGLLFDQSRFYFDRGQIDKALSYCHRSIQVMLQLDEKYGKGVIWESQYAYLGDLYVRKGDYISAAHYHNKAMREGYYDVVGWELDRAVLAMNISLDYEKWDDAQKGVTSWWEHARDIYQERFPKMEIRSKEDFLQAMEWAANEAFERECTSEYETKSNKLEGLCILDDRIDLFRRIYGETKALAQEYRRLAMVYRQYGEEVKCRKYLRMARKL